MRSPRCEGSGDMYNIGVCLLDEIEASFMDLVLDRGIRDACVKILTIDLLRRMPPHLRAIP